MPQPISEMGEGKAWSILAAQQTIEMPVADGLAVCVGHADAAAQIYDKVAGTGESSPQVQTSRRLAAVTGGIIRDWQKSQATLPLAHEDLAIDVGPRIQEITNSEEAIAKRIMGIRFNPYASHLSAANKRLRLVRMAVPELLRQRPKLRQAAPYLADINTALGQICLPGQLTHKRGRQRSTYGGWF